jgi:hypothetical protein
MSLQTQYTLLLDGFQAGSSARKLKRFHFSKGGSESGAYKEGWLQSRVMAHPSLLPVDQIEPAFNAPVPAELPVGSGFVDNLLMTPAGYLALVDCKLWRNPEARPRGRCSDH